MDLIILAPEKETVDIHNVSVVSFNGVAGQFQVLPGHAEMVSIITPGRITYSIEGNEKQIDIAQEAIINVKNDMIQVFV